MTDSNHPITPPPELVQAFLRSNPFTPAEMTYEQFIATRFARWGADKELEACCEWLLEMDLAASGDIEVLRDARRLKPPSIKQQALRILAENGKTLDGRIELEPEDIPIILSAIQSIPEK